MTVKLKITYCTSEESCFDWDTLNKMYATLINIDSPAMRELRYFNTWEEFDIFKLLISNERKLAVILIQKYNHSWWLKLLWKFNQLDKHDKDKRNIDSPSVAHGLRYFSTQES